MKHTLIKTLSLSLVLVLMSAATAFAKDGPPSEEKRAELVERMRTLRAVTLTERLELDEKTATELSTTLRGFDDQFMELQKERRTLRRDVRDAMEGGKLTHKEVDTFVDAYKQIEIDLLDLKAERSDAVKKILSPEGRVRFMLILDRFERQMKERMNKVKKQQRDGQGRGE